MTDDEPVRWAYRLDAYRRALARLTEAVDAETGRGLADLEKMGLVQVFEFTVELGWKLIGDVLDAENIVVSPLVPNAIIRAAFEREIIADGRGWLSAVKLRNELSHIYREELFLAAVPRIVAEYFPVLRALPAELDRLSPVVTLVIEPTDAAELRQVLWPLRSRFQDIRVFGSRATGRARRTSDIDLVVYGADPHTVDALIEALDDSLLPMTADVLAYETITSDVLRAHIDRVATSIWEGDAR